MNKLIQIAFVISTATLGTVGCSAQNAHAAQPAAIAKKADTAVETNPSTRDVIVARDALAAEDVEGLLSGEGVGMQNGVLVASLFFETADQQDQWTQLQESRYAGGSTSRLFRAYGRVVEVQITTLVTGPIVAQ